MIISPEKVTRERPPIVVVMGHVDHGKTTLLDTLRKRSLANAPISRVKAIVEQESGGITQHIGAYEIEHKEKHITFVDTPGHEAFSSMRHKGAHVADVALLMVAADDGVKPQTKEALSHIKVSEIPFIVVINKIDRPAADPSRVKNELAQEGVLVEGWGGQVPVAEISAKEATGIEELLDLILLVAELEELTYSPVVPAEGFVLESHLDARRGLSTALVVTNGTIRTGDILVCGSAYGRVKIMEDSLGKSVKGAVPSTPVSVIGLSEHASAGDVCRAVLAESEARGQAEENKKLTEQHLADLRIEAQDQTKVLSIILKADVQGSLEAIIYALKQIQSERVGLRVMRAEVGQVGEDDVKFAEATNSHIFGFHVDAARDTALYAEQKGIPLHLHTVIYELIEEVRKELSQLLEPEVVRTELGRATVLKIFHTEASRMIVGVRVVSGKLVKGKEVQILRADAELGAGKIVQLQKGEEKHDEVTQGNEAGIMYDGPVRIKEGDVLVAFEEEKTYPTL